MEGLQGLFSDELPLLPGEAEALCLDQADPWLLLDGGPLGSCELFPTYEPCPFTLNMGNAWEQQQQHHYQQQQFQLPFAPLRSGHSSQNQATMLLAPVRTTRGPPTKLRCLKSGGQDLGIGGMMTPAAAATFLAPASGASPYLSQDSAQNSEHLAGSGLADQGEPEQNSVGSATPGSSATVLPATESQTDSDSSDMEDEVLPSKGSSKRVRQPNTHARGHTSAVGSKQAAEAPEVDWRTIADPAERRRQRRLAKNRMTAARSRERKKVAWAELEAKLAGLEAENTALKQMLQSMSEDSSQLRKQLDQLIQGGAGAGVQQPPVSMRGSNTQEPAVLAIIAILLLLCVSLSGDQVVAAVGAAAPWMILLIQAQQEASSLTNSLPAVKEEQDVCQLGRKHLGLSSLQSHPGLVAVMLSLSMLIAKSLLHLQSWSKIVRTDLVPRCPGKQGLYGGRRRGRNILVCSV